MSDVSTKSRGKGRKIGRNKKKCERYKASKAREYNKYKRVLKSSGANAAKAYALKHALKVTAK